MQNLARGRIARWGKERIDALSTPELRQLLANALRLKETELAALCDELLGARPRGHAATSRQKTMGGAHRLAARGKSTG